MCFEICKSRYTRCAIKPMCRHILFTSTCVHPLMFFWKFALTFSRYHFGSRLAQVSFSSLPLVRCMDQLVAAKDDLMRNQQRVRNHKRRHWGASELSVWCLHTALCISCMTNYDFDVGVAWLLSKERRGAAVPADATADELKSLLEDAFLQLPQDRLNCCVDTTSSTFPRTVMKTASAYAQGHILAAWVREKNASAGFVVRTERLIEHYNEMNSSGSTHTTLLGDVQPHTHPTGRKWAQRWREKHSGYIGSLSVREPITADEIRQKVSGTCQVNLTTPMSPPRSPEPHFRPRRRAIFATFWSRGSVFSGSWGACFCDLGSGSGVAPGPRFGHRFWFLFI